MAEATARISLPPFTTTATVLRGLSVLRVGRSKYNRSLWWLPVLLMLTPMTVPISSGEMATTTAAMASTSSKTVVSLATLNRQHPQRQQVLQQKQEQIQNLNAKLTAQKKKTKKGPNKDHPPSLRLTVRQDTDYRSIHIHLTRKALFLMVWLALGIILLYEMTWVAVLLFLWILRSGGRQAQPYAMTTTKAHHHNNNSTTTTHQNHRYHHPSKLDYDDDDDAPSTSSSINTTTTTTKSVTKDTTIMRILLLLVWFLSTMYGIFYSFEVIFLYLNDKWYDLLAVQLFFTLTDMYVWIMMVMVVKYPHIMLSSKSKTTSSSFWRRLCLYLKFGHLSFNLLVERDWKTTRHLLFFLEDASCLAMAPLVFRMSLANCSKRGLLGSTLVVWLAARILSQMGNLQVT